MQGTNARWSDARAQGDRPCGSGAVLTRRAPDPFAELYAGRAAELRQLVRLSVRAPDAVIDDACQVAWSRLLRRWGAVRREAAFPWLVRTASRAAVRSMQRSARELSLDQLCDAGRDPTPEALRPATPDEIAVLRARLDEIRALPDRQQLFIWLQGLGLTYDEMADYTQATRRTVERQLMRAKRSLRAA
jgi:RNA polymerase sigma factor (sigma-70 family)